MLIERFKKSDTEQSDGLCRLQLINKYQYNNIEPKSQECILLICRINKTQHSTEAPRIFEQNTNVQSQNGTKQIKKSPAADICVACWYDKDQC